MDICLCDEEQIHIKMLKNQKNINVRDNRRRVNKAIILVSKMNYLQNPDHLIVTLQKLEYALEAFVGVTSNKNEIFEEFNNKNNESLYYENIEPQNTFFRMKKMTNLCKALVRD